MSGKVTNITKAMVLAAGRGERMRPLTDVMPKPLVPVSGKPLIDWQLDMLQKAGVKNVVINSSYLAEQLEAYVTLRKVSSVTISREKERLETGGGIVKALPLLGDKAFFTLNSDVILQDGNTPAMTRLMRAWDNDKMDILMLIHPVEKAIGYDGVGDFFVNNGRLCRRGEDKSAPYVFTGIQIIHPRLFEKQVSPDGCFSLNVLYNKDIDDKGWLNKRISYLVHDGEWLHVGTLKEKQHAEEYLNVSN